MDASRCAVAVQLLDVWKEIPDWPRLNSVGRPRAKAT
jgi:hypothetical protein